MSASKTYDFELTVTDNEGATDIDTVTITVTPRNEAPTAKAIADKTTVTVGTTITLDASSSTDPNQDQLIYTWSLTSIPEGSTALISDTSSAAPTYVPDVAGSYTVDLAVMDPGLLSDATTLSLTAVVVSTMVKITGNTFQMGDISGGGDSDEKPIHSVTVVDFELSQYEMTVAQFRAFVEATNYLTEAEKDATNGCAVWNGSEWIWTANLSWRDPSYSQTDNDPVVCVSWNDAQAYISWLNEQTGLKYRLPTEAEWEYAARAGTSTKYSWGDTIDHDNANYGKDSCCDGLAVAGTRDTYLNTAPVGQFPANPFGLHDMHGNVREWTEDCWHSSYTDAPSDSSAWLSRGSGDCSRRVLRGGSWNYTPGILRSANRSRRLADFRDGSRGFRLARTL